MRLTFLGTGTSFGVPVVGCSCSVCHSSDARDRRTRHALLLEGADGILLVDTPPELRLQLISADVERIDAAFLSHPHADHVHGIDDLRVFATHKQDPLPVYLAAEYEQELRRRFSYFWGPDAAAGPGTTIPGLDLRTFVDRERVIAAGLTLDVVGFPHGWYRSYGFRTDDVVVIIDAKQVPEDAVALLRDARVLVINALWFGDPHPTHFNIEEAIETARRLEAARTYLTHLTHRLDHEGLIARLPEGIEPAYDGLVVEV